jgi:transcriptional regulator with XRE-family HTH domain
MATQALDRTLAALVAAIRRERGWTLKEMSEVVGIPLSTLGKVESGKLSLSYDKLQQFTAGLGMSMADFFSHPIDSHVIKERERAPVTARRSLTSSGESVTIETPNYVYNYLCADLTHKQMVPIIVDLKADTPEVFGPTVSHAGEEFIFVLEGEVQVNLEFYRPTILKAGEGIYVDSMMKHSYTLGNCDSARLLAVCSGDEEALHSMARDSATE